MRSLVRFLGKDASYGKQASGRRVAKIIGNDVVVSRVDSGLERNSEFQSTDDEGVLYSGGFSRGGYLSASTIRHN
ncbi:hypothetical protein PAAG_08048 [Paracoccidioides lutzii Pb01]|uniref:Uncharacterized protein n=1 Tax=Paracoccidioides lutzii (strain ATCC MYA-826 / Pb01) TaxID=502779 RepID=C1HBA7_PARBA|nr:hypothetical protein PAAG_08048 [Paracoccidioides lutzii Pb01]EEH37630.2 hypothetical protein PAAG_08048 [Paracoccidioides lutzii Pb01]